MNRVTEQLRGSARPRRGGWAACRVDAAETTLALVLAGSLASGGCAYQRDEAAMTLAERGAFGAARARVAEAASNDPEDRNFILDQMKLVSMGLAEGIPEAVEPTADRLYDRLRTQGLNDDNRFASIVLTEGSVRIYKGDPFEQALAYYQIALTDGVKGDWGNVRAASQQSLFLLRDFSQALQTSSGASERESAGAAASRSRRSARDSSSSQSDGGSSGDGADEQVALVRAAAMAEKQGRGESSDALGVDYKAVASDFEIGYALRAIASGRLGEREDMAEALATLDQIAPRLSGLTAAIRAGDYNTVFVIDHGLAPEKYGTGPDGAVAARAPTTASDDAPVSLTIGSSAGGSTSTWPVVTDVNRIARSTKWANLEDVRIAKSNIGSVLVAGGLIAAATADDDDDAQRLAGLIVAGVGALMKATSAADTRHNELFPQRVYIALATLPDPVNRVELAVGGSSPARLVFPDLPGPASSGDRGGSLTLHYVRLPTRGGSWATAERIQYTNDRTTDPDAILGEDAYPFILGGRDASEPSLATLSAYQRAGYLIGMSVGDLEELYREEGIRIAGRDAPVDQVGLHVLEGGTWLYTPIAGSTGYKRLYYDRHPAYRPRSPRVESLAREIAAQRAERSRRPESMPSNAVGPTEQSAADDVEPIGSSRRQG